MMNDEIRSLLRRGLELRDRPAMDHLLIHLTFMQVSTPEEIETVLIQEIETADQETKDYWNGPCDCIDPRCMQHPEKERP